MSGIIWIIVVGFVAGIIARMLSPGPNNPAGFITATIGALVVLFIWNRLVASRVISDPGNR